MKVFIDYAELQTLAMSIAGQEVQFAAVDEQTIKVTARAKVKIPLLGEVVKPISVEVTVDSIDGTDVYLKYSGGLGVDLIINGILLYTSHNSDSKIVEQTEGNGMVIHLSAIEQARKVLDLIELTNITFLESAVSFDGTVKIDAISLQ